MNFKNAFKQSIPENPYLFLLTVSKTARRIEKTRLFALHATMQSDMFLNVDGFFLVFFFSIDSTLSNTIHQNRFMADYYYNYNSRKTNKKNKYIFFNIRNLNITELLLRVLIRIITSPSLKMYVFSLIESFVQYFWITAEKVYGRKTVTTTATIFFQKLFAFSPSSRGFHFFVKMFAGKMFLSAIVYTRDSPLSFESLLYAIIMERE